MSLHPSAVLAGAVIMAGCASAKDGGTSTADDSAVGTVEQFTGQAVVPVTETVSPAAEPATDGETPDLSGLPAMTLSLIHISGNGELFVQIWKSEELLIEICMEISYD